MKISVITVCYNAEKNIKTTIDSVISQTYKDFEYIIVDGASTDATASIVEEYRKKFAITFVSEKDKGIYDAMNKGVRLASGQWINFMNAGDFFIDKNVLEQVSSSLSEENDFVYGATKFCYDGFSVVRPPRPMSDFWIKMPFNHQGLFEKTSVLKKHPFDIRYALAADYEQILFGIKAKKKFFKAPMTVAVFNNEGTSNTKTAAAIKEYAQLLEHYHEMTPYRKLYYKVLILKILGKKFLPAWFQKIVYENYVR
jgi:glycosyltransferase involved in cell wall biosynthesis